MNHLTSKLVVCTRTDGPGARSWIFSESPLPLSYVEPRMIVNQKVATCLLQGCYKLATIVTMNGTPARQCCCSLKLVGSCCHSNRLFLPYYQDVGELGAR